MGRSFCISLCTSVLGEDAAQKASSHEDDEEFIVESDSNSDRATSDSEGMYHTFLNKSPLQINTSPI